MKTIDLALFVLFLFLGSYGWGKTFELIFRITRSDGELSPALDIALGSAIFIGFSGLLVSLNLAFISALIGWHLFGCLFSAYFLLCHLKLNRNLDRVTICKFAKLFLYKYLIWVFLICVVLSNALININSYNPNDDNPAYTYLADRMIQTGGMFDPFNARRILNFGGNLPYNAIILNLFGSSSLRTYEFIFSLLLAVFLVLNNSSRKYFGFASFILVMVLSLGGVIGPISNTSSSFSSVVFILATYLLFCRIDTRKTTNHQNFLFFGIGLTVAALITLRSFNAFGICAAFLLYFVITKEVLRFRQLFMVGVSSVLVLSGWMWASWTVGRTPLYPLFKGNYTGPSTLQVNPTISSMAHYFDLFWKIAKFDGQVYVLFGCLACSLISYYFYKNKSREVILSFCATVAAILQIGLFAIFSSGGDLSALDRYTTPMSLACGLFAISIYMPNSSESLDSQRSNRGVLLCGIVVTSLLLVPSFLTSYSTNVLGEIHAVFSSSIFANRWSGFESEFGNINNSIPRNSRVLVDVEMPELLNMKRLNISTVDEYGFVSPAPGLPYFRGSDSKVAYLKKLGFQYILQEFSPNSGTTNSLGWFSNYRSAVFDYRTASSFAIDWLSSVHQIIASGHYKVLYFGDIILIEL